MQLLHMKPRLNAMAKTLTDKTGHCVCFINCVRCITSVVSDVFVAFVASRLLRAMLHWMETSVTCGPSLASVKTSALIRVDT